MTDPNIALEQKLADLYFEVCDREGSLATERRFSGWIKRGRQMARAAVGKAIRVRMKDSGNAAARWVRGTIASVEPSSIRWRKKSAVLIWKVRLESGRTVYLERF
jgi:hypothetical protein